MAGVDPLDKAFNSLSAYRSSAPDAKKEFARKEALKLADLKAEKKRRKLQEEKAALNERRIKSVVDAQKARKTLESKSALNEIKIDSTIDIQEPQKSRVQKAPITDAGLLRWVHLIAESQGSDSLDYLQKLPKQTELYRGHTVGEWTVKIRNLGWVSDEILALGLHRIDLDYPLREEELVYLISKYQGKEVGDTLDIADIPKTISGHSVVKLVRAAINTKRNILEHVGIDSGELYERLKGMTVRNSIPVSKGLARLYAILKVDVDSDLLFYFPKRKAFNVENWSVSTWVDQVCLHYNKGYYTEYERKLLEASGLVTRVVSGQSVPRIPLCVKRVSDYNGDIESVRSMTPVQEAKLFSASVLNTQKFNEDGERLKEKALKLKTPRKRDTKVSAGSFPQSRTALRYDDNVLTRLRTYSADGYFSRDILKSIKEAESIQDVQSLESKFLLILEGAVNYEEKPFIDLNRNFRMSLRLMISTVRNILNVLEMNFTEHPLKTVIESMLAEEDTLVTPVEIVFRYNKKVMTHRQAVGFLSKELLLL